LKRKLLHEELSSRGRERGKWEDKVGESGKGEERKRERERVLDEYAQPA
jgi:hypothetical protein